MISLQTFERVGYSLENFRLENPDREGRLFTYYTFLGESRPELLDVWEIVGMYQQSHSPLLLDMRLMHLEDEMFNWNLFRALPDAPAYLSLNPGKERALIAFLESLLPEHSRRKEDASSYFDLMAVADLEAIHLPAWKIPYWQGQIYRYHPDPEVQSHEEISVVAFPRWSTQHGANQVSTLAIDGFLKEQLADRAFQPFGSFGYRCGTGTMIFNQPALEAFIFLLKHHAYGDNTIR